MAKKIRHVMGLSGGKDSTALAVFLQQHPDYAHIEIEYFFCDTHKELPETYDYLDRIEARLGIQIQRLQANRGFDHWLDVYEGVLPSPKLRWCTKQMKIIPFEQFIKDDDAISYIGIRADENREGYISSKPNIQPVFPFKEHNLVKSDIVNLLEESGIGLPDYYRWRSRSGCFFCFFQRKYEWVMLSQEHPDLYAEAIRYEEEYSSQRGKKRSDDHTQKYTWTEGETLRELLNRKDEIIDNHQKTVKKINMKDSQKSQSLAETLDFILNDDSEDVDLPCLICHL